MPPGLLRRLRCPVHELVPFIKSSEYRLVNREVIRLEGARRALLAAAGYFGQNFAPFPELDIAITFKDWLGLVPHCGTRAAKAVMCGQLSFD